MSFIKMIIQNVHLQVNEMSNIANFISFLSSSYAIFRFLIIALKWENEDDKWRLIHEKLTMGTQNKRLENN